MRLLKETTLSAYVRSALVRCGMMTNTLLSVEAYELTDTVSLGGMLAGIYLGLGYAYLDGGNNGH